MINRIVKWIVFKCIYPISYRIAAFRRLKKRKVLFVENHQDTLSDNFLRLYKTLEEREYEIHVHFLKVADSGWKDIIIRTLRMIFDMADAKCVFISESNSVFGAFRLRKGTKLVQVWHACGAFKKWGFSVAEQSFGDDRKELMRYSGHRNYSLVPVSGQAVCWAYAEAFGLQERSEVIKPLGVSRTDAYFDEKCLKQAEEHLNALPCFLKGRKVVLYAPTFRGEIKEAVTPKQFDLERFYDRFHKEYILLIKQHPFVKKAVEIPERIRDACMEITTQMTTEELLMVADVCITDYSSVVFDYSLRNKPMLFFAFDLEEYYDERGFYYPYEEFVPGPVVRTMDELMAAMEEMEQFDENRMKNFRDSYMSGCDGHATERIVSEIFG